MKLFAIMYIHGHLAMALYLWPHASIADCQKINAEYSAYLDARWKTHHLNTSPVMVDPDNKQYHLRRTDIRLACEWHNQSPLKEGQ